MVIVYKSKEDILNETIYQIRDGIVLTQNEEIVFSSSQSTYSFNASTVLGSPVIIEILYVEGFTPEENYINNIETINGIDPLVECEAGEATDDFEIWVDGATPDVIDDNPYTTSHWAGTNIYDGIKFNFNPDKLKDGEIFKVTYTYYDVNKVSQITNFSEGTLSSTLVDSNSTVYGNMYVTLKEIENQSNLDTATGLGIDKHGSLYNLERYAGTKSTGYVTVTNDSTTTTLIISTTSIFVTERTTDAVLFKANITTEVPIGQTKNIYIESIEVGKNQNVGVGSITKIYINDALAQEVSDTYTCTNTSYVSGVSNIFNDGSDLESDVDYKARIKRTTTRTVTSRKDAIKNAVTNLSTTSFVKVQDWEENKLLATGTFNVMVVGEGDKLISKADLDVIQTTVDLYKPIGTSYSISRPHPVYIDLDLSIYIDTKYWSDVTEIESDVGTTITNYINSLTIGEDFKQSQLLKEILKVHTQLENAIVDDLTFTVYSYDPYEFHETDAGYQIVNGTTDYKYAQGFFCTTKNYKEHQTYDVDDKFAYPITAHNGYVEDTSPLNFPSTYLVILDSYNNYIRDPRYTIDYSSGENLVGYEYKALETTNGDIVGRPLYSGDNLVYDYHYIKYDKIDGVRFWLEMNSAADGLTMDIDIYSGAVEPTTPIGGETAYELVYADAVDDLLAVDIQFSSSYTLASGNGTDDPAQQFWLVIQNTVGNTGGEEVRILMSKAGDEIVPIGNPDVMIDEGSGWDDISLAGAGTDWVNRFANMRTFMNLTQSSEYFDNDKDVEADLYARYPEIIVLNNINITSSSVVVD